MNRFVALPRAVRWIGALALIGLGLACSATAGPSGLNAPSQRITDEAIGEDLQLLKTWRQRLDGLAADKSPDPARRYLLAKAQAWLGLSTDEYWANDRGPIVEESLGEAMRLSALLIDGEKDRVEGETKLPNGTRIVRPDLWMAVKRFKAHPRFDLVAEEVAQLEVELVRAGHDGAPGAACSAEPHIRASDSLGTYVDSVLKSAPAPAPVVPVVPPTPTVTPPDRDRDGVPDMIDCCPNTPAGLPVDARGCPPPTVSTVSVLDGVEFDIDRYVLRPRARSVLDSVGQELLRRAGVPVALSGHTDSIGTEAYNQTLSENRARTVRQYLIDRGVASDRISSAGYGETRPRDTNRTSAGRQRNRRVELTWQQPEQPDLAPSCAVAPPEPAIPAVVPDVTAVTPTEQEGMGPLLDRVLFASASMAITQMERARLVRAARELATRGDYTLEVVGHADDVGDRESNLALSLARAWAVRAFLVDLGVPASRLVVSGFGAERPAVAGRSRAARAHNRRVDLLLSPATTP